MAKRIILFVATMVWLIVTLGPAGGPRATSGAPLDPSLGTLKVHFIDVGQGDATLIQSNDVVILIDAGRHDRNDVVPYLREAGITSIDLLVGTHPHADHIGQFPEVLEAFPVKEVWLSGDPHTSKIFEDTIDAILASEAGYHEPRAGETFQFGAITIEIVHPEQVDGDFNNGSIGMRVVFGDVVLLFTGDAEAEAEHAMIERGHALQADALQLGHHGSSTSSSLPFLLAVNPSVAIYSAGQGNTYGHPHREVIARLKNLGIRVYGTDVHGTIWLTTDGRRFDIETEKEYHPPKHPYDEKPDGCLPGQVNVNTAPPSDLTRIVHIGPVIADRVVSGRSYDSLDDLLRVPGIGESRLIDIKEEGIACAGAA